MRTPAGHPSEDLNLSSRAVTCRISRAVQDGLRKGKITECQGPTDPEEAVGTYFASRLIAVDGYGCLCPPPTSQHWVGSY